MSAETKGVVYQLEFECPRCKAKLQLQGLPAGSWVRCPKCGKASLAPDPVVRRAPEPIKPEDDALILGPAPEPKPMTPVAVAMESELRDAVDEAILVPANPFRVAAGAGLCVATILAIFAALEHSDIGMIAFAALAVACLFPLMRIPVDS